MVDAFTSADVHFRNARAKPHKTGSAFEIMGRRKSPLPAIIGYGLLVWAGVGAIGVIIAGIVAVVL